MSHCAIFVCYLVFLIEALLHNAQAENFELPSFTALPPSRIYQSTTPMSNNVTLVVRVHPIKSKVQLMIWMPNTRRLEDVKAHTGFFIREDREKGQVVATLPSWVQVARKQLHWLASTSLGSVVSPPFWIDKEELGSFPQEANDKVDFLMGNVGRVSCLLPSSTPSPPSITFLHNDKPLSITSGGRYRLLYLDGREAVLLIKNLRRSDTGIYKCTAKVGSREEKATKVTQLTVKQPQAMVNAHFRFGSAKPGGTIEVIEGSNLTLYCVFEGAPVSQVMWYYAASKEHITQDEHFATITIRGVTPDDATEYSCFPEQQSGVRPSIKFTLKVHKRIKMRIEPSDVQVEKVGNNASLKCEVAVGGEQLTRPPVWFFNGQAINSDRTDLRFRVSLSDLAIPRVSKELLGVYQCWAMDKLESWVSKVATLTLAKDTVTRKDTSEILKRSRLVEVHTSLRLTAHLQCDIPALVGVGDHSQDDGISVQWYYGSGLGRRVENKKNSGYKYYLSRMDRKQLLSVINPMKPQDEGIYTCRIYDKKTNTLIAAMRFNLIIDEGTEVDKETKPKPDVNVPDPPDKDTNSKTFPINELKSSYIADYLLAVKLRWSLSDSSITAQVDHYRIEYKERRAARLSRRRRLISGASGTGTSTTWSEVKLIDAVVKATDYVIQDASILRPGCAYSFRILGVPKIIQGRHLNSDWSPEISFGHIVSAQPVIKSVTPLNGDGLKVEWAYSGPSDGTFTVDRFHVLLRDVPSTGAQTGESSTVIERVVNGARTRQLEVTGLNSGTKYEVFVYGEESGSFPLITQVSEAFVVLVQQPGKGTNEEKVDPGSKTDKSNVPNEEEDKNPFLFLVLGSLAGVLFVIAAVLMAMCVWYQLREKYKTRGNSPSPFKSVNPQLGPNDASEMHYLQQHQRVVGGGGPGYLVPYNQQMGFNADDPTNGGYLEAMGLMNDHRLQQLRQQQMDQASSIYSQIGSEHRSSNTALNQTFNSRMLATEDGCSSDDQQYLSTLPPGLAYLPAVHYSPAGLTRGPVGGSAYYQAFYPCMGPGGRDNGSPAINGHSESPAEDDSNASYYNPKDTSIEDIGPAPPGFYPTNHLARSLHRSHSPITECSNPSTPAMGKRRRGGPSQTGVGKDDTVLPPPLPSTQRPVGPQFLWDSEKSKPPKSSTNNNTYTPGPRTTSAVNPIFTPGKIALGTSQATIKSAANTNGITVAT